MTTEITKELIEQARQQRIIACQQRIEDALREFDCALVGVPQYTPDGRTVALVQIVSKT